MAASRADTDPTWVRVSGCARGTDHGFTLIELMVVVIIIGIIAALAAPSMRLATFDRHAYQDAGIIMQLFREARSRAIGLGAAEVLEMKSDGSTNRGQFTILQAVQSDPANSGAFTMPVGSCKSPTVWLSGFPATQIVITIDGIDLNSGMGSVEVDADIETTLNYWQSPSSSATSTVTAAYMCFTPLGRSFFATTGTDPLFDSVLPSTLPITVGVTRAGGATTRNVLVPADGLARLQSVAP